MPFAVKAHPLLRAGAVAEFLMEWRALRHLGYDAGAFEVTIDVAPTSDDAFLPRKAIAVQLATESRDRR